MDKKLLSKAVFIGLFIHIIVIAFYATYNRNHLNSNYLNRVPSSLSNQQTQQGEEQNAIKLSSSKSSSSFLSFIYKPTEPTDLIESGPPDFMQKMGSLYRALGYSTDLEVGGGNSENKNIQNGESGTERGGEESDAMKDDDKWIPDDELTEESLVDSDEWNSASYSSEETMTTARPPTRPKPGMNYSLIYNPSRTLTDENHPQFNRAFDKNIMPFFLLGWKPSPDSASYFRQVDGATAWMYSAFLVDCSPPSVRLIGLSTRYSHRENKIYCHYLDENKIWKRTVTGMIFALKDNHMLKHSASAIECSLPQGINPIFVQVSKLSNDYSKQKSAPIPIQRPGTKPIRDFTLCYSPLHSLYNSTYRLVQSIELNKQLGASHFYFYNFSISKETDEILRYYESEGAATILQWPLPHLNSWYYGQIAAINDCIYKNRIASRYVVIVDTDEFIIPNKHSSWLDLINDVIRSPSLRQSKQAYIVAPHRKCILPDVITKDDKPHYNNNNNNKTYFGSFMFRCAFFAKTPLSNKETIEVERKFKSSPESADFFTKFASEPVQFLKRNDILYDYESRSKLIVRPETVVSHAIHKTVEHILGFETAYVDQGAAFMHHYRAYKIKSINTLDYSALKFRDNLYIRLKKVLGRFPKIFGDLSIE